MSSATHVSKKRRTCSRVSDSEDHPGDGGLQQAKVTGGSDNDARKGKYCGRRARMRESCKHRVYGERACILMRMIAHVPEAAANMAAFLGTPTEQRQDRPPALRCPAELMTQVPGNMGDILACILQNVKSVLDCRADSFSKAHGHGFYAVVEELQLMLSTQIEHKHEVKAFIDEHEDMTTAAFIAMAACGHDAGEMPNHKLGLSSTSWIHGLYENEVAFRAKCDEAAACIDRDVILLFMRKLRDLRTTCSIILHFKPTKKVRHRMRIVRFVDAVFADDEDDRKAASMDDVTLVEEDDEAGGAQDDDNDDDEAEDATVGHEDEATDPPFRVYEDDKDDDWDVEADAAVRFAETRVTVEDADVVLTKDTAEHDTPGEPGDGVSGRGEDDNNDDAISEVRCLWDVVGSLEAASDAWGVFDAVLYAGEPRSAETCVTEDDDVNVFMGVILPLNAPSIGRTPLMELPRLRQPMQQPYEHTAMSKMPCASEVAAMFD